MPPRRFLPEIHAAFRSILLHEAYVGCLPSDLNSFTWVCHQQGVLGGLTLRLREFGHPDPGVREWATERHRNEVIHTSRYLAFLARLHEQLQSSDLPVLLLKGAALNLSLYSKEPGLRHLSDVDLFVQPGRQGELVGLLRQLGFRPRSNKTFFHESGINVDLHGPTLGRLEDACGLKAVSLWERALTHHLFPQFLILNPWDQLSHLSAHALKHSFERLVWLLDIALLSQSLADQPVSIARGSKGAWEVSRFLIATVTEQVAPSRSLKMKLWNSMLTHYQHPLGAFLLSWFQPDWKGRAEVLRQAFFDREDSTLSEHLLRTWRQTGRLLGSLSRVNSSKKE